MEVPRLGAESELQLWAYTSATATATATATRDSWPTEQGQGLNLILMDSSPVCHRGATTGTPETHFYMSHNMGQNLKISKSWLPPQSAGHSDSNQQSSRRSPAPSVQRSACCLLIVFLSWECACSPGSPCALPWHSVLRGRAARPEEGIGYYLRTQGTVRCIAPNLPPTPEESSYTVTIPGSVLLH